MPSGAANPRRKEQAMTKRVEIYINEKDLAFIKWMAKKDTDDYGRKVTVADEMRFMFNEGLENCWNCYGCEFESQEG